MKKNRWIAILLALTLPLALAACGRRQPARTPEGETVTEEEAMYTIVKTEGEPDWSAVPALPIDRVLWTPDVGIRAEAQLCWGDDALYVHLRAVEQEIRAVYTEPLSPVYQDSCLEFFFQPEGSDNYFNFEVNPNGCMCVQVGPDRANRVDLVKENAAEYFRMRTNRTEDGWEIFYAIPLSFLRLFDRDFSFAGGMTANFYKCGDRTAAPHYLAWNPVLTETPDFHRPEYFGAVRFAP